MSTYRRRHPTVTAVQFTGGQPWPDGVEYYTTWEHYPAFVWTDNGWVRIVPGWWVVTEADGKRAVYSDARFRHLFEPVDE